MATGRSEPLRLALMRGPADLDIQGGDTPWRIMLALMDRDYDRAAAVLARSPRSMFQDVDLSFYYPRSWYEGVIARAAGRSDEARAAFRQVLADLNADDPRRRFTRTMAVIAQARAAVGETERAIQLAERATQTVGPGLNAYDAPLTEQGLAQVYTWTGQPDRALEIIERLVKAPGYLSYGHLLHDPAWEPLRGHPRFQALTASLAPLGAKTQASSPARQEATGEKSIAVLPFRDLSSAPENAYFAAGVQDAVLTDLAKIADLKVINRTSVQHYSADAPRNLREISEQLRVAYVLEGSVQRVGDRVRVTAKLTEARTNTQRWAERYDRDLADVFAIQNEIANAIALQLRAWLSPTEQAALRALSARASERPRGDAGSGGGGGASEAARGSRRARSAVCRSMGSPRTGSSPVIFF
jgi:TolB-like protein